MDPNATLAKLLDAFRDNDREASWAAIEDLQDWLARGGFMPADPRAEPVEPLVAEPLYGCGLFRRLNAAEEAEFRAAARRQYTPLDEIDGKWHPVYVDECRRMNERHYTP